MQRKDEYKNIQELFNKVIVKDKEVAWESHKGITKVLLTLLNPRHLFLPKKRIIKIASLGCGVPVDYLALRAFYDPQDIQIHYTGIDINADLNAEIESMFSNFSDSFSIITGDCSNKDSIKALLETKGCMPESGFDLVVLRQPNILDPKHQLAFTKMILEVIPFISAQESHTFISCYHEGEMSKIVELLKSGPYLAQTGCGMELDPSSSKAIIDGHVLILDQCSVIVGCAGSVYPRAGSSRVASVVTQNMFAESKQFESRGEPREIQRQIDARVKAISKERRSVI